MSKFTDANDKVSSTPRGEKTVDLLSGLGHFPVAEALPVLVWTMTPDGQLDYANAAWFQYTGWHGESSTAIDWELLLHPADVPEFLDHWRDTLATGTELEAECRLKDAHGKYRWHMVRVTPVRSSSSKRSKVILWIGSMTDLQRQKEAEEALYGSEQRFKVLADAAPVLIWMAEPDKLRNYFNKRWLDYTGRRLEQERGNGWAHGLHPDDTQPSIDMYVQSFEQHERYEIEYRLKRADGKYRWMLEVGVPLFTPYGTFAGYIGSCMDIDDRKRAEEELRRSRDQLEAIFKGVGDGITVLDTSDRLVYANDAAARMLGFSSAEELIRSPLEQIRALNDYLDDDGRTIPIEKLPVTLARKGFKVPEMSMLLRHKKSQAERWVVTSSTPVFAEDGSVQFVVTIFRDVSHQKQEQRSLLFLAEATMELHSSLDYRTTLRGLANRSVPYLGDWCIIHLIDDAGAIRLMTVATQDETAEDLRQLLQQYAPKLGAQRGIGYVIRTGKPEYFPVIDENILSQVASPELSDVLKAVRPSSAIMVPLSSRGKILGCITLVMAGSRRRYSKADLLLSEELARRAALAIDNARLFHQSQQALALRDEFLSIASHELKTPVTSIKAVLQALERRMEHPEKFDFGKNREYMALSVKQVDRLNAIVSDLLDVNRMNQKRLDYNFKVRAIGPVIAEVVERMAVSTPGHHLSVKLQSLTAKVKIDEIRFEQVLTNLITNAVKYSPEGSTIEVYMHTDDGKIIIEVKDRGMGIAPEDQPHIFDRYYRTPEAIKSRASGMGVGLFISNQIVQSHGGTMKVKSDLGKGSTFIIELPCAEEDE